MATHFLLLCVLIIGCSSKPLELTQESFDETVSSETPTFVKFYAPWCGYCKRLAPTWDDLSDAFSDGSVVIAKMDCTQHTALCSEQGVKGYPTLKLFVSSREVPYTGQRDLKSLKEFVQQQIQPKEGGGDTSGIVHLDDEKFESFIAKDGLHFVKFYAPWCGHCQRLAPTWEELGAIFKSNPQVQIIKVDCTKNSETCKKYGVQGYPTLVLFENGEAIAKHKGGRTLNELLDFIKENMNEEDKPQQHQQPDEEASKSEEKKDGEEEVGSIGPVILNGENFDKTIAEGLTFVKFYAPWCGHCKRLAPTWDTLAELMHATTHTTIAKVDCTVERELCSRYEVRGYPTLILFSDGVRKEDYKSARDLDSLEKFLKEHSQGD